MQEGIALQYAKPLLAAEVRRIFPTAVGVPMEFSFYSAAVAAASVNSEFFFLPLIFHSALVFCSYKRVTSHFDIVLFILLVQATITPPLPEQPETITLEQLMRTDVQFQAEVKPRYTFTYTC